MKRLTIIIIAWAFALAAYADETADHSKFEVLKQNFENATEVTKACLSCHTEAGKQLGKTTHWTWEFSTKGGRKSGKYHVINNFCVAVKGNEPRCTSCHTGYGWKNKKFDHSKEENMDCLVCHAKKGAYKKFPIDAGHPPYETKTFAQKKEFKAVDLTAAAQSVSRPDRKNCGVCHFNGGGGNGVKHGDLDQSLLTADKKLDVHMGGQNMVCVDCHKTDKHEIPGSIYEYHDPETRPTCSSCHTDAPHKESKLNDHTDKVACQTCHIPAFARGGQPTVMSWDWSKAGDKKRKNTKNYQVKKGEFVLGTDVMPRYFWHNGDFGNTLATDKFQMSDKAIVLNPILGKANDTASKIFPFKVHHGKQIFDTEYGNFIVPKLFGPKESGAYWKNFDWNKSAAAGMANVGLPYSGQFGFVETEMNWVITHMVAPKEEALSCNECHTSNDKSRLAGIEGVYMPGRDHYEIVDTAGFGLMALTLLGVLIHMTANIATRKNRFPEDDE